MNGSWAKERTWARADFNPTGKSKPLEGGRGAHSMSTTRMMLWLHYLSRSWYYPLLHQVIIPEGTTKTFEQMGAQSTSMSLGERADDDQMMWTPSDLPKPRYTLRWLCLQHWKQNIGRQRKKLKTFPGYSLDLMLMKWQPGVKQMFDFTRSWRGCPSDIIFCGNSHAMAKEEDKISFPLLLCSSLSQLFTTRW